MDEKTSDAVRNKELQSQLETISRELEGLADDSAEQQRFPLHLIFKAFISSTPPRKDDLYEILTYFFTNELIQNKAETPSSSHADVLIFDICEEDEDENTIFDLIIYAINDSFPDQEDERRKLVNLYINLRWHYQIYEVEIPEFATEETRKTLEKRLRKFRAYQSSVALNPNSIPECVEQYVPYSEEDKLRFKVSPEELSGPYQNSVTLEIIISYFKNELFDELRITPWFCLFFSCCRSLEATGLKEVRDLIKDKNHTGDALFGEIKSVIHKRKSRWKFFSELYRDTEISKLYNCFPNPAEKFGNEQQVENNMKQEFPTLML